MKKIKWANKELPGLSHDELLKMTNRRLASIENGAVSQKRHDSDYQSEMGKLGGAKGAAVSQANQRDLHGDNYNNVIKERLYNNIKNKTEFHSKGGHATAKKAAETRDAILIPYFKKLTKGVWLTSPEFIKLFNDCAVYNAGHKFKAYHKDKYTTNGARGANARIMLNPETNKNL